MSNSAKKVPDMNTPNADDARSGIATRTTADVDLTSCHLKTKVVICGPNGGASGPPRSHFTTGKDCVRIHLQGHHVVITNEFGEAFIHSDQLFSAFRSI